MTNAYLQGFYRLWCPKLYSLGDSRRMLLYRQGRFLVGFLVPDWEEITKNEQETWINPYEAFSVTKLNKSGKRNHRKSFAEIADQLSSEDLIESAPLNSLQRKREFDKECAMGLLNMCGQLQRAMSSPLDSLYTNLGIDVIDRDMVVLP